MEPISVSVSEMGMSAKMSVKRKMCMGIQDAVMFIKVGLLVAN